MKQAPQKERTPWPKTVTKKFIVEKVYPGIPVHRLLRLFSAVIDEVNDARENDQNNYSKRIKNLTPKMVTLIIEYEGLPPHMEEYSPSNPEAV